MNAEELIEEVSGIVDDPVNPSIDSEEILKYLNRAQLVIANKILLPGLADGEDIVTTVVNGFRIPLPDDYHRGLFLVRYDDKEVMVVKSLREIVSTYPSLSLTKDLGDVAIVAPHKDRLAYYPIPELPSEIHIFYHRKPEPMTESNTSYPDGLSETGDEDDAFHEALIFFACWKLFSKIEQGVEGAKVDTSYNAAGFNALVNDLDLLCTREGKSYPKPQPNKVW